MGFALGVVNNVYHAYVDVINPFGNATSSSFYVYGEIVCIKSNLNLV